MIVHKSNLKHKIYISVIPFLLENFFIKYGYICWECSRKIHIERLKVVTSGKKDCGGGQAFTFFHFV